MKTGTARSPVRSVRKIASSPVVLRCSRNTSAAGVRKLDVRVAEGPPPIASAPVTVTVYSVSSQSGTVKRTPMLRPEASTVNGTSGSTLTCSAVIGASA